MNRLVLAVYWVVLAASTHYPQPPIPRRISHSDKMLHFGAFAVLAYLLWRVLASSARGPTAATVWIALAILVPYATIDEYTQQFVGRSTELFDWLANLAGLATVLVTVELARRSPARA